MFLWPRIGALVGQRLPDHGQEFYDLNRNSVISPYTGEVVPVAPVALLPVH